MLRRELLKFGVLSPVAAIFGKNEQAEDHQKYLPLFFGNKICIDVTSLPINLVNQPIFNQWGISRIVSPGRQDRTQGWLQSCGVFGAIPETMRFKLYGWIDLDKYPYLCRAIHEKYVVGLDVVGLGLLSFTAKPEPLLKVTSVYIYDFDVFYNKTRF